MKSKKQTKNNLWTSRENEWRIDKKRKFNRHASEILLKIPDKLNNTRVQIVMEEQDRERN